ncbi:hypothetical protein BFP77_04130 [Maribacter sp. 4U21]|uniref:hypothetical protein n=1 Tax=Maribacter sp. 4U21 TaxID=1889779 RepID=UPI000C153DCA|nr:hypothetical protein [Maribacter sp. 4U21]PIB30631.1 hypothetical protein BFP77_04130 [Maribacter sp. 4U21]
MKKKAICLATNQEGNKCLNEVLKYGERCKEHKGVRIQYFYGFYTSPKVAVIDKEVDLTKINSKILKETAYSFSHQDIDFIVCRDGLILASSESINKKISEFKDSFNGGSAYGNWRLNEGAWASYLEILNTLYLLLECAQHTVPGNNYYLFRYFDITRNDIVRITYENDIPIRQLWFGSELAVSLVRSQLVDEKKLEQRNYNTPAPVSIFNELENYIKKVNFYDDSILHLTDLARILARFHEEDYRGSFLLGWLFIEENMSKKWDIFLNSKNKEFEGGEFRISNNRKKILRGRDYSISIVLNQLELNEIITYVDFKTYDGLRKIRNNVIHSSYRPNIKETSKMLKSIKPLFEETVGYELKYHDSRYGSSGL